MTGYFITLEGPDGSGKTGQITPLAEYLRSCGHDVLTTREPGGTLIGDQVRNVIMDLANKGMNPRTEILLFQASRVQIVEQVIRPALEARKSGDLRPICRFHPGLPGLWAPDGP